MKSCEERVGQKSEYFIYSPSITAKKNFFYPLCTGHFFYEKDYSLQRNSYDSFLLMYLLSGEMNISFEGTDSLIASEHFILLDCYKPHRYFTRTGCECLWIHFDGPMAGNYYELVTAGSGNFFSLADYPSALPKLEKLYRSFSSGMSVREPFLSKLINDIFTLFLLGNTQPACPTGHSAIIGRVIAFINEHFTQELDVETMAGQAMMSTYHFIRVFKRETGFTPHDYLINIRINNAKYMLKNSDMSIKDICFQTGFSCESVFCTSFKNNVGVTPTAYKNNSF